MTRHALVAVPVPLGQAFSYGIPDELAARVVPGARVLCPFGPSRSVLGVVLAVSDEKLSFDEKKLKYITAVVDEHPVIPEELLAFLVELSRYYLAPVGEVMRLALPAVERSSVGDGATLDLLHTAGVSAIGRLVQVAAVVPGAPAPEKLSDKHRALLDVLRELGPTPVAELERTQKGARSRLKKLEALGAVRVEEKPAAADPFFATEAVRDVPPELTPAQARAVSAITSRIESGAGGAFLLHGVTASGKTEVYLRAVSHALERGGSAIVLVPEIALTPQLVNRFRSRLGEGIAVLHSGLSDRERHAMWRSLRGGAIRVAVGARSALFAPPPNLALVCVDEEHDGSFKQEEGVRYHARDMALLRAHRARAVCVLGSATPSLASEALVRAGKLERLSLPERAHRAAALPKVEIVDLRVVGAGPSGDRLLSLPLHRALERTLAEKEQAILFLNRRGFSPALICEECGHVLECPSCAVALTLHRSRGERVHCHYCDYSAPLPTVCPDCKATRLSEEGAGTERIEALLKQTLPEARIARLDRDVAAGLKSEAILDRMRRHEVDVLVGTQMVTKGHDLPGVTLVGVLNADSALAMPDYQAAERTFQLLVQVAGRAGRGDRPGTVVIQTRNPKHPAILAAVKHDVGSFVEQELREREDVRYPPFSRIALVRIDAVDEAVARREAERLASVARRASPPGVDVVGPAPAPLARLRNRYRYRFLVRGPARGPLRTALVAVARAETDRRARVAIDVDPVSML
ncbi:MAG TPA: primosomal protein N' [Polyangiaceae bacterium]|nr:primosomal protein N' [Polyangiaceae bacterium]